MKKKGIIVGSILVTALAAAYFGGRYYYTDHFYPNTTINQVTCSNQTAEQALDCINQDLAAFQYTIHDDVTDMVVSASDAGLVYDQTEDVSNLLEAQDENLWFTELTNTHDYEALKTSVDEEKLEAYLNTLECMNPESPQKPVNAKIRYSKETKCYEIIPEVIGNTIVTGDFYAAVAQGILNKEEGLDLTTNAYYLQPRYTADHKRVLKAKKKLDKYMSSVITYKASDIEYTVDGRKIHKLLKVGKKYKVSFREDKVRDFIAENISSRFNTVGTTRSIYSPGSGNITISGGEYGWRVSLDNETEKLIKNIKKGKILEREPEYLQEAKCRKQGDDIGDSFIDVNISAQHLWVVRDGSVVMSSDFVSGNPYQGHATHKGVFFVEFRRYNYGMPRYNVTVKYWIPFNTGEGEGFHDATWRSTFGGSYYLGSGSHGCINMPLWSAQWIYNNIPCNYPVIVH